MKKLLLIATLSIGLISCKKEDEVKPAVVTPAKPVMVSIEQRRDAKMTINGVIEGAWVDNGLPTFYSNNLADEGKILSTKVITLVGGASWQVIEVRVIVKKQ